MDPQRLREVLGHAEPPLLQATEASSHRLVLAPKCNDGNRVMLLEDRVDEEVWQPGVVYTVRDIDEKRKLYSLLTPSMDFWPIWYTKEDDEDIALTAIWKGAVQDIPPLLDS